MSSYKKCALFTNIANANNSTVNRNSFSVAQGAASLSRSRRGEIIMAGVAVLAMGVAGLSSPALAQTAEYFSVNTGGGGNKDSDGATGGDALAAGVDSTATGNNGTAVGAKTEASGRASTAVGTTAKATADDSVAVGAGSEATGTYAAALGAHSLALADFSTAIGGIAEAEINGTAIGHAAWALGASGTALGYATKAGESSVAVGNFAEAVKSQAVAIGNLSEAGGDYSIAVGDQSVATATNSIAIGASAVANSANGVALGAGSVAQAAVGTAGATIRGQYYGFAGSVPAGVVSIGDAGSERTLTNLAAGRLSASSTDAVNGSQLYATNQALEKITSTVGGVSVDVDDLKRTAMRYDTNPDGTLMNSVTLQGADPNAPVLVSNVAAGVANTDAVNLAQMKDADAATLASANSYVDGRVDGLLAEAVSQAGAYMDSRYGALDTQVSLLTREVALLNKEIGGLRSETRQAAAIGLAAASLRYDDRPGKLSLAMGAGSWRGEGAGSVGLGYTSKNQGVRANIAATTTSGSWGGGAGLSFTLN